jgi:hypothetical protein
MSVFCYDKLNYYILSQLYWRSPKHTKGAELIKKKDLAQIDFISKEGKTARMKKSLR